MWPALGRIVVFRTAGCGLTSLGYARAPRLSDGWAGVGGHPACGPCQASLRYHPHLAVSVSLTRRCMFALGVACSGMLLWTDVFCVMLFVLFRRNIVSTVNMDCRLELRLSLFTPATLSITLRSVAPRGRCFQLLFVHAFTALKFVVDCERSRGYILVSSWTAQDVSGCLLFVDLFACRLTPPLGAAV